MLLIPASGQVCPSLSEQVGIVIPLAMIVVALSLGQFVDVFLDVLGLLRP